MLGECLLLSLYNGLVLPHLQYCLMVWGNFEGDRNKTLGGAPVRLQKRRVGLIVGKRGLYHADPLFARFGVLKEKDLYRQQLRVHAWQFWNGRLLANQVAMLGRVESQHGHGTRSARGGLAVGSRDHGSVGYRIPKEWGSLTEEVRGMGSVSAFKRRSKGFFLVEYGAFGCNVVRCVVCQRMGR